MAAGGKKNHYERLFNHKEWLYRQLMHLKTVSWNFHYCTFAFFYAKVFYFNFLFFTRPPLGKDCLQLKVRAKKATKKARSMEKESEEKASLARVLSVFPDGLMLIREP